MSLLNDLRNLLSVNKQTSGKVVSVGRSTVSVATRSGLIELQRNGAMREGDNVSIDKQTAFKITNKTGKVHFV